MVCKVLCITLLACVVVQAAPKFESVLKNLPDVDTLLKKFGDAAKETFKEAQDSKKDHISSVADASKALYSHGLQSLDTKKVFIKSPFKFGKKVIDIIANADKEEAAAEPPKFDADIEIFTVRNDLGVAL